ncbi:MAG TPA: hypothetical protein VFG20_16365 [Planctomycetaceae bacterium]|jgi:cell division protein ZapA (FtsZ GTPase activity inhibitor)|nr:hypothetical protein [Planctomycetaceae bacterium]
MSLRSPLLSLAVLFCAGLTVAAQEIQKEKKKPNASGENAQVFQLPKEITLTAEQQAKMDTLKKEFGPKIAELQKKSNEILTKEQREARKAAADKAKADGLKGKAMQDAVNAAVNATPEQKEKLAAVKKELDPLITEVKKQIENFLTEDQRAKLPKPGKKKAA